MKVAEKAYSKECNLEIQWAEMMEVVLAVLWGFLTAEKLALGLVVELDLRKAAE